VVINERTGTIVMGHGVRIATVAVTHGSLRVRIEQETEVVQPPSFSQGQTVVSRTSRISAREEPARSTVLQGDTDVAQLVEALNAVGASPREIIGILQAIQAAGALYGELEVI